MIGFSWNMLRAYGFHAICTMVTVAAGSAAAQDTSLDVNRGALAGERMRVIVSSDIGGSDPDDIQSMVHFLLYADLFDVEGLIASPPDEGRAQDILDVIDAYEHDYPNLVRCSEGYPEPDRLRAVTKQGALEPSPEQGYSEPTAGSRWIIERAHADDDRPLYVLVWGSITDVAQAVHDDPAIAAKLRVVSIGSWNTHRDRAARNYLFNAHPDLWWVESDSSFRGMYVGGRHDENWGNKTFVDAHVRGHGALGDYLAEKLEAIKMGDSPSVLYLLRGNPDAPTEDHWGGRYIATQRPNHWNDIADPALGEGKYPGAKTVNVWREDFLTDWMIRMDRTLGECAK